MAAVMTDPVDEESLLSAAWKRIRSLTQHLFELDGKVERINLTLQDIGKVEMAPRGPDPDLEEKRYTYEEVQFLTGVAAQNSRRNYGGHHGGPSNAANHAWNAITVACVIGGVGLLWNKVDDHSKQLARIECQLSPATCQQLQASHAQ